MKRKVFSGLLVSLLAIGCDQAVEEQAAEIITKQADAEVFYNDESGSYDIKVAFENPITSFDVSVSTSPDGDDAELIFDNATMAELSWSPENGASKRHYFLIEPEGGRPSITATRVLPLEGGRNFRSLGGYPVQDGREIKWGQVFRSGVMHTLTPSDYEYLSGLGIKVVCDLRASDERQAEPTVWGANDMRYVTFADPAGDGLDSPLAGVFRKPDVTPDDVRDVMTELYNDILEQQAPAYRVMFDELANGELPLAFNCSAGKDRTGVGAGLLLSALGVDRDTIIEDYALSEKVVDYMAEFKISASEDVSEDSPYAFLRRQPPELVAPLMRSDPVYLQTLLERLDREYGSVTAYIQAELGVDESELETIRARLLN